MSYHPNYDHDREASSRGVTSWTAYYNRVPESATKTNSTNEYFRSDMHVETCGLASINVMLDCESDKSTVWYALVKDDHNFQQFQLLVDVLREQEAGGHKWLDPHDEPFNCYEHRSIYLPSLIPFLDAGIKFVYCKQQKHHLVLTKPGVPHMVNSPPTSIKIARNVTDFPSLFQLMRVSGQEKSVSVGRWFPLHGREWFHECWTEYLPIPYGVSVFLNAFVNSNQHIITQDQIRELHLFLHTCEHEKRFNNPHIVPSEDIKQLKQVSVVSP